MNTVESLRQRAADADIAIDLIKQADYLARTAMQTIARHGAASVSAIDQLNRAITSLDNAQRMADQARRRWLRKAARKAASASTKEP